MPKPLIPELKREAEIGSFEFKAILIYITSYRKTRAMLPDSVPEKKSGLSSGRHGDVASIQFLEPQCS